jgi:hypothetical protein
MNTRRNDCMPEGEPALPSRRKVFVTGLQLTAASGERLPQPVLDVIDR